MRKHKPILLFSFLIIFAVFKLWIRVSAIKTAMQIKNLRKELILTDSGLQRLRAEYYHISAPSFIESIAREKLLMRYPKKR